MIHSFYLRIAHHVGGCHKLVATSSLKVIKGKNTVILGKPIEHTNFLWARGFSNHIGDSTRDSSMNKKTTHGFNCKDSVWGERPPLVILGSLPIQNVIVE